jgi:hypothetical protein
MGYRTAFTLVPLYKIGAAFVAERYAAPAAASI